MSASTKKRGMRAVVVSGILAVALGLSAHAAFYVANFSDSGPIPQGGITFSVEETISGAGNPISFANGITLVLTFNDSNNLNGNILGSLILNPAGIATYASFTPQGVGLSTGTGGQEIYTMTFSDFGSLNPNNIWVLNLWDMSNTQIENGLVSWTLDINSPNEVPEPTTFALTLFALVFAAARRGGIIEKSRKPK